jgi:hypothetical protein
MNVKTLGGITLAFTAGSLVSSQPAQAAFGICSQPFAPSVFLSKPDKPYCAISHDCTEADVQQYRDEINDYFDHLKRYAGEVDDYYNDAQTYIKCMADLD